MDSQVLRPDIPEKLISGKLKKRNEI